MGQLIRCITSDGMIAATALDSTDIVARAEQIHTTSAVVTAALGRVLTATSIMGCALKGEDQSVTLRVKGDGPVGTLLAVSDAMGNVRGYAANPVVELPLNAKGKLDVGGAVGKGMLFVTKDLGLKEPYNGAVDLVSGEIAEDIAYYFGVSEQIPTVCALGVLVNPDLTVRAAGGYLLQLLPAAGEDTIERLEKSIEGVLPVTVMLEQGVRPLEILQKVLHLFEVEVLDESRPAYVCNCSEDRVKKALLSMGRDELERLAKEQEQTEVRCQFCERTYTYSREELERMAKAR